MKKFIFLLSIVFLIGCESRQFETTDEEFKPYVEQFKKDYKRIMGKNIDFDVTVNFKTIYDNESDATCYHFFQNKNEILVNKWAWSSLIGESKLALIYHELGHCVFDYAHRNKIVKNKINDHHKVSIMYYMGGTMHNIGENKDLINEYYLQEFFTKDDSIWEDFK